MLRGSFNKGGGHVAENTNKRFVALANKNSINDCSKLRNLLFTCRKSTFLFLSFCILASTWVLLFHEEPLIARSISSMISSSIISRSNYGEVTALPRFTCPLRMKEAKKNHADSFDEYLVPIRNLSNSNINLRNFLETYRDREYDDWEHSYVEVLEGMRHWKETRFVPNVQSGDHIYESACGIGMNLLLTLEVLHGHGIHNVHLYGNEVLAESAHLANKILDTLAPNFMGVKGALCPGDSTNIAHSLSVPADSFDLVWTGYMSELYDPLEFYANETYIDEEEVAARRKELCRSTNKNDWKSQTLLNVAAERMDQWYGQWVAEMVRIAKPGKVVIIEQIRRPRRSCLAKPGHHFEYLSRDWWGLAIDKYQWDVDPESLDFEDDVIFRKRYHVLMRKRD